MEKGSQNIKIVQVYSDITIIWISSRNCMQLRIIKLHPFTAIVFLLSWIIKDKNLKQHVLYDTNVHMCIRLQVDKVHVHKHAV